MLTEEEKKAKRVETSRKYYIKNKEKIAETSKKYYIKNKEKINERCKIWRENNKEKTRQISRKYRLNNKEKTRASWRNWFENNKDYHREYYLKNKEAHHRRWRDRYRNDPNFKLRQSLARRVRFELRKHILKKTQSSLLYVGCSTEQLKNYLESKFEDGMTWDNWSVDGWHIDHVIPCSSFDLTKEKNQKKCFHYTNLQPLWAKDNLEKSNKLDWVKECT